MSTETLMTETAATTTESPAASQAAETPATASATPGEQAATQQQATSEQTTTGEKPGGENAEGDQAQPQGAPEKYDFKTPEGVELDGSVVNAFSEAAKELNLPQDAAQKVIDKMAPVMAARQAEQLNALNESWVNATKADAELGGEKLGENLAVAIKARDAFASPELRTLLEQTKLGNNPEVIRMFYRVGSAISEDRLVVGGSVRGDPDKTIAQRMYPNMNP